MRRIWFPFYLDDYDSDTAHLTFEQHGAYLALLRQYYRTGKPLPANAEQLHRICRATTDSESKAIDDLLAIYFTKTGGKYPVYNHKRADEEIAKSFSISEKRSKSAKSKCSAIAPTNAQQLQTQSQSQSQSQEPKTKALGSSSNSTQSSKPPEIAGHCLGCGRPRLLVSSWTDYCAESCRTGRQGGMN